MTTVYKASFFSRIGSVIGTLFAVIPLVLFWAFIVFLLEEIVPLPDIVYLVFAGILGIVYIFLIWISVKEAIEGLVIEIEGNDVFIKKSGKIIHEFKLDRITVGYRVEKSRNSYTAILKVLDYDGEKHEIDCSLFGSRKFEDLLEDLKAEEQVTKL